VSRSPSMRPVSFPVTHELSGWELFWVRLEILPVSSSNREEALAALRRQAGERARAEWSLETLSADSTVAAVRSLFRAAGCDPTRYRPSSEALLRRLLKGEELPAIHPFVDLNNCLSVTLRAGRPGESYESLRGPFNLEGKPLLADRDGAFGTPITDSQRVKVTGDTRRAWMVAYLPAGVVTAEAAEKVLQDLLIAAPAARMEEAGASGGGR